MVKSFKELIWESSITIHKRKPNLKAQTRHVLTCQKIMAMRTIAEKLTNLRIKTHTTADSWPSETELDRSKRQRKI